MFYSGSPAAGPAMANPLTTQSQVVINARYDRYFTNFRKRIMTKPGGPANIGGAVEDECFDVMPRELGMALRSDWDVKISRPINYEKDREMRIFTSANGLPYLDTELDDIVGNDPADERQRVARLREQLMFVGVPLTKVLSVNQNQTDAVSVQVSGSVTIFNTGIYDIHAFDLVMWDVPHATTSGTSTRSPQTPGGLPTSKRCFWTVPLRMGARDDSGTSKTDASIAHCTTVDVFNMLEAAANLQKGPRAAGKRKRGGGVSDVNFWDLLKQNVLDSAKSASGTKDVDFIKALQNLMLFYSNASQRYGHRVIGIALSKSRPGEPFDILLQKAL